MKWLHIIAMTLVFAGGINWGLIGFFKYDLVLALLGSSMSVWVYMLVGLATVYILFTHRSVCKICGKK